MTEATGKLCAIAGTFLMGGATNCFLTGGGSFVCVHKSTVGRGISCFSTMLGGICTCTRVCVTGFKRVFDGSWNRRCSRVSADSLSAARGVFRGAALPAACSPPAGSCDPTGFERSAAPERLGAGGCRWTKRTEYFLVKDGGVLVGVFTDHGVISSTIRTQCNTADAAKPGRRRRWGVLRVLNLSTKSMC